MALIITQTDSAGAAPAQACSATAATSAASRTASAGGSAGSTPVSSVNQNSGTHLSKIFFEWTPDSGTTWAAGTWTVRVNISTGNTNLTLENVHICRMNSSNVSQATIGSLTAQAVSASAGTKTFSVSGSSQTPSVGDKVWIIVSISNQSGQMNQQLSWTPSLNIDTPFAATHTSTGVLTAGTGALAGTANRTRVHPSSGALSGGAGTIAGTAEHSSPVVFRAPLEASIVRKISRRWLAIEFQPIKQPIVYHDATGDLVGPGADLDGTALREGGAVTHETSGVLTGPGAVLAGTANRTHVHPSTGVLVGSGADLDGTANRTRVHATSGVLTAAGADLDGTAAHTAPGSHPTSGALTGPGAALAGTAAHSTLHATSGALSGPGAVLSGTATHSTLHATSGALTGPGAVLVGTAAHFTLHATTSVLTGPGAVLAGVALRTDPGAVPGPGKATPSDRFVNGSATNSDRAATASPTDRGLGSAGLSER